MLSTNVRIRPLALLVTGLLLACGGRAGGPRLDARWIGSDTGAFTGTAKVVWCGSIQRLELIAVDDNDAGIGLTIFPAVELRPGHYDAFDPGIDTVRRPGAAAAARFFTEQAVKGFQSDSGSLDLERTGSTFGARFGFRMRSLEGGDTVRLTGHVKDVVPGRCPGDTITATVP
ncbi:MAG: hypothetical protein ABI587_03960 [Gemmatimonadales bacterium]